jgi:lipopolysaccharide export LptBFGC system permease protein LptF
MMRLVTRTLATRFLVRLGACLGFLSLLFISQLLIPEIIDRKYPVKQLLFFHLLSWPQLMLDLLAPSVLIAFILTQGSLKQTREWIALLSLGISASFIRALFVGLTALLCAGFFVLSEQVFPVLHLIRQQYYWHEMRQEPSRYQDLGAQRIWFRSERYIVSFEAFEPATQKARGAKIYELTPASFGLKESWIAPEAFYKNKEWCLQSGSRMVHGAHPRLQHFSEQCFKHIEGPSLFQSLEDDIQSLRFQELLTQAERLKQSGLSDHLFRLKAHLRVSHCVVPVGLGFLIFSPHPQPRGKGLLLALVLAFFYWLFYSLGLSLGTKGSIAPWVAAWAPACVLGGVMSLRLVRTNP